MTSADFPVYKPDGPYSEVMDFGRGRPITAAEAREVPLSMNPIKRLGQLAEYGSGFYVKKTGSSPLPLFATRGDLVRTAEAHEWAVNLLDMLEASENRDNLR